MAPKKKISKAMILEAAFNITRKKGFEDLNARSLATEIGCSTQPIFSRYENMDELNKELYLYVGKHFDQYAIGRANKADNFFREIGNAYVDFAKDDSNLFKFLFMSESMGLQSFSDMYGDEDNLEVAKSLSNDLDISLERAQKLYMKVWIFNHGIASMVATEAIKLTEGEAEVMMEEAVDAFIAQALLKK